MSTQQQQPTVALAKVEASPMVAELAGDWKISPLTMINTLKATIFKAEVSNETMVSFLQVCNTYKLNPFVKEIYAFPLKGGGFVPMVPIDGWTNIINRNAQFDGLEFFDEWVEDPKDQSKRSLFSTTCTIYRKDRSHPIKVTEYMQECYQPTKEPWVKWPARMLRHKALIQCARIAFSLAGIYDPDEAERIANAEAEAKSEIKRPTVINATPSSGAAGAQRTDGGAAPASAGNGGSAPKNQPAAAAPSKDSAPDAVEQKGEATPETAAVEESPEMPGTASSVKCFCTCCKNANCTCLTKEEFERCGCPNCKRYMELAQENPERPTSAAVDSSTVAQSDVDPGKPEGPYVEQKRLVKLFAVAAGAGIKVVKGSHDDELHKVLKDKWKIESLKEIPVALFDEIVLAIGEKLKVK